MKKTELSWWECAERNGFSIVCCEHFEVNFDNAPTLVVRSEFIPTRPSRPHTLHKTIKEMEPLSSGRVAMRAKQIACRMSEKAMRETSALLSA